MPVRRLWLFYSRIKRVHLSKSNFQTFFFAGNELLDYFYLRARSKVRFSPSLSERFSLYSPLMANQFLPPFPPPPPPLFISCCFLCQSIILREPRGRQRGRSSRKRKKRITPGHCLIAPAQNECENFCACEKCIFVKCESECSGAKKK